jgi:hypothetical protein
MNDSNIPNFSSNPADSVVRPKEYKKKRMVQFIEGNGKPFHAQSIYRNQLCPCGSGKKVKHCHKLQTRYFTKKTKEEIEVEKHLIEKEKAENND